MYFALFRNQFSAFLSLDIENCGNFDSETSIMTVAPLANSRALHAARRRQALSLFLRAYNSHFNEFDGRLKSIPFSILDKYRSKRTKLTSLNIVGGNLLKMLFRSELLWDSESNVKRLPQQVVCWPTNDGMYRIQARNYYMH